MKAFFIKDWKLLKNQGKMFGAVLVFYGLLAVMDNSMGQSILGFFPFLFGLFTISTISYDEYQHGMTYLMTLPIKRKTYVTEKYLFAMALTGAGSLLIFILELLYSVIMHRGMTEVVMWEILSSTCFMIPVVILFLALALPLNLKFGSEKGRSLFSGMMLGFFLSGIVGVKKLKGSLLLEQIQTLLHAKGLLLVTAGIVIYALALGISYRISVRIIEKREF